MTDFDKISACLKSISICNEGQLIDVSDNFGGVRRVRAFSTKEYDAREIHAIRDSLIKKYSFEGILLIIHLARIVDFPLEEKVAAAMKGMPLKVELFFDIWVVDDDGLETQLKMLNVLGYPDGGPETERLVESKILLRKIYEIVKFKVWKVNPLLGALFDEKPSTEQSLEIAGIVVPFLEKYGDVMYSSVKAHAKALRSMVELQM